ncbi:dockerin type I domain-containing protein [Stieleria varia]|uniref:Dockerin type I repeat protein n=1 Tax=Stieleria varia TaxID=2528005 RepID=A0A5C6APB5_9BACT|nr:dockerin type I domain-containing protein [Stieleria varia]TWU00862.1 Dockerin type I repeat protein [Stieleria varia]
MWRPGNRKATGRRESLGKLRSAPKVRRGLAAERLESRQMMAADSIGVTPLNTAEFLLGKVVVTPVFFESDGSVEPSTEDWTVNETEDEIGEVLAKISDGVNWWSDFLDAQNTVHSLEFIIDDTYARDPFETGIEPIANPSHRYSDYVADFLIERDFDDAPSIERAVQIFNDQQRQRYDADWAFTIFVVDSSNDGDGFFEGGGAFSGAFAFAGGFYMISPSTREASTFAHEMGHIFWAHDEYPGGASWTATRGYYNTQNLNAANNPTPGFVHELSIMRSGTIASDAFDAMVSPEVTLATVGWQDSDGDGIFDVLDVPLDWEAVGYFDASQSQYHLTGSASAVPLRNLNSSGIQSDITLNEISEIQYRLDEGVWVTAQVFGEQHVTFDLVVPITTPFSTIQWRAIDRSSQVTSEVISAAEDEHAFTSGLGGFVFEDTDGSGQRDAGESLLSATQVTLLAADGSPLFGGSVHAEDLADIELSQPIAGASFSADGVTLDGRVGVFPSPTVPGIRSFQAFDGQRNGFVDRWSQFQTLDVSFDESVGFFEVHFTGLATGSYAMKDGSYARVEAFDSNGVSLGRRTSDIVLAGQTGALRFDDPDGRIASVRVMGHAQTEIVLTSVDFGFDHTFVTDAFGAWHGIGLPDGEYLAELTAENLIHQWPAGPVAVQVQQGAVNIVAAGATRVDSPRHNTQTPEDVNGDQIVTALDALNIINDLAAGGGARILGADEATGVAVDVNNDGRVSALDALLVVNALQDSRDSEGEGELPAGFLSIPENTAVRRQITEDVLTHESNWEVWGPGASDSDARMFNSAGPAQSIKSNPLLATDTDSQVHNEPRGNRRESELTFEKFEKNNFGVEISGFLGREIVTEIRPNP